MSDNAEFDAIIANLSDDTELTTAASLLGSLADKAAAKLRDNGLCYLGDHETESIYAVRINATTVFVVKVDNADKLEAPGLPEGVSAHRILVQSVDGARVVLTGGVAARAPHNDGTGTHVDGQTVASYVLPRAVRFIQELAS